MNTKPIDPAFDASTKTWFLPDDDVEAPTVRELIEKLPYGPIYVVEGYNHLGDQPSPPRPSGYKDPEAPKQLNGHSKNPNARDPVLVNKALDMWASGVPTIEIARATGFTKTAVAAHIIPGARKKGDPRAVIRNANSIGISRNKKKPI